MIETVIVCVMGAVGGLGMGTCLVLDALRDDLPAMTAFWNDRIRARRSHSGHSGR